ncbi:MAG TPA: elongation factor Ts [Flammeovirgaceae bacterium]|nr:elongation factor Ts [Flammeovirgaceae bacterium]
MAITAKEVNELRKMTGAGMMDCKKALVEADGDFDKAIDILRTKGQKVSAARADRDAREGVIVVKSNSDNTESVLIGLACETDFVAKNDEFVQTANRILDIAFENKPADVEALLALPFDDKLTVAEKLTELIGKIGEKIEVSHYERMNGEMVVAYVHAGNKLGVLVSLANTGGADVLAAGKDVAMQIAAMRPVAVSKDKVDQATIDHELAIGREQALAEGKPENIVDKIAQGKLNKFFQENTLLAQKFVKDNSMTVEQYLNSVQPGLTVADFKRIAIGG